MGATTLLIVYRAHDFPRHSHDAPRHTTLSRAARLQPHYSKGFVRALGRSPHVSVTSLRRFVVHVRQSAGAPPGR